MLLAALLLAFAAQSMQQASLLFMCQKIMRTAGCLCQLLHPGV